MNKFVESARKIASTSPLMVGREKLTSDDVVSMGNLTIDDVDIVNYVDKSTGDVINYAVLTFKECPDKVYTAGMLTTEIINEWLNVDESEIERTHDEIKQSNIKYALRLSKTKNNNSVYIPVIS